jgi:acyl-CoA thioesterase FadM
MAAAPSRIERPYRVRFDEAGPDGLLRSSGYLRFAQDLAWIHSEGAGFGRDWYGQRGLTWLVRAVELDILSEVLYGTDLVVSTEVVGFRRVWARRRSQFHTPGSERPQAEAITDWVLLNARGAPTRVPAELVDHFADGVTSFTPLRLELPPTPATANTLQVAVRRSDLDPMAHVNNAAYLDYLDEHHLSVPRPGASLEVPRRYRAEFIASAEPGTNLVGHGWQDELAWLYRLEADDGREMLRARLETDPANWVGG